MVQNIFMKNNSSVKFIILALAMIGLGLFFVGCAETNEENSTLPWSQPSSWESNKMPGMMMPNYSDKRDY